MSLWLVTLAVAVLVATSSVPPFFSGALVALVIQALRAKRNNSAESTADAGSAAAAVVSVVGNIGSGKTTALKSYATDAPGDVAVVAEPVDEWAPLLEKMTTDKDAWMDLQVVIASFYATLVAPAIAKVMIQERDLMSVALFAGDREGIAVLLMALVECGKVVLPDIVVHIATPWENCLERVQSQKREQAGDTFAGNLGAEYFRALDDRHQKLLEWYAAHGCLVITVRTEDTAVIGLTEAREQALAARVEGPRRFVTKDMMLSLLLLLWPPTPTAVNNVD